MPGKKHVIDTVVVKSGAVDTHVHGLPQQLDSFQVVVHPDTLLVDVVSKEGCDPIFGWSWDAWQGTGQWLGPVLVFILTLYFERHQRQKAKQREQSSQVAHFTDWRTVVIAQVQEQLNRLNNFIRSIEIREASQMPSESLLRFQLDFDLWLQLTPAEMTRVFVLNKEGKEEKKRKDLQDVLSSARDIEEDFNGAKAAVKLLYDEYVQFVEEWNERYRAVTDMFLRTVDPRFIATEQLDGATLTDMHSRYVSMPMHLLDRQSMLGDLVQELTRLYLETRKAPYHELGIRITRLKASIDQMLPVVDQSELVLRRFIQRIQISLLLLDGASEHLAGLKDRPYMKLV